MRFSAIISALALTSLPLADSRHSYIRLLSWNLAASDAASLQSPSLAPWWDSFWMNINVGKIRCTIRPASCRRYHAIKLLNRQAIETSIISLQGIDHNQVKEVIEGLEGEWETTNPDNFWGDVKINDYNPILYRPDQLEVLRVLPVALYSEIHDHHELIDYPGYLNLVLFKDKNTEVVFWVGNTHIDDREQKFHIRVEKLAMTLRAIQPQLKGKPAILSASLSSPPEAQAYKNFLRLKWTDIGRNRTKDFIATETTERGRDTWTSDFLFAAENSFQVRPRVFVVAKNKPKRGPLTSNHRLLFSDMWIDNDAEVHGKRGDAVF